jgi:hypothetical protein
MCFYRPGVKTEELGYVKIINIVLQLGNHLPHNMIEIK